VSAAPPPSPCELYAGTLAPSYTSMKRW